MSTADYALAHKISRVYAQSPVMRRDREDLVQEAVLGVFRSPGAPRSTVMTRRIVDYIRHVVGRDGHKADQQIVGDAAGPDQFVSIEDRVDLLRVLRKAVAALEAELDLSTVEELSGPVNMGRPLK